MTIAAKQQLKIGHKSKVKPANIYLIFQSKIEIFLISFSDQQENGTVNYSNIVQRNSNGPVVIEPAALKREKRLVDKSDTTNTTFLGI